MVLGKTHQLPLWRPMVHTCHHLETIQHQKDDSGDQSNGCDDLDKYWRGTTWQRTAQGRLTCKRHAEVFTQSLYNTCTQWWWRWCHLPPVVVIVADWSRIHCFLYAFSPHVYVFTCPIYFYVFHLSPLDQTVNVVDSGCIPFSFSL